MRWHTTLILLPGDADCDRCEPDPRQYGARVLQDLCDEPYVVSYIYEKEEREQRRDELQHLFLRLVSRQEAEGMVAEASKRAKVEIEPLEYFDRSG